MLIKQMQSSSKIMVFSTFVVVDHYIQPVSFILSFVISKVMLVIFKKEGGRALF